MTATGGTTAATNQGGLFEDVIDVYVRPVALFDRVRNQSFVRPALIQTVLFLVLVIALNALVTPFMEAEMARGMAASGQEMPEGAAAAAGTMAKVTGYVGPVLAPWLVAIGGGLATWLAAYFLGARMPFGQAATIASWSYFPAVLGYIVMAAFGALGDSTAIRSAADGQLGVARFLDPTATPPAVYALLLSLELFTIWSLVLTAIGVAVIARTSRSTGAVVAIVRFALGALVTVLPAALR